VWYIVSLLSLLSLWSLESVNSDTYTHAVGYVMCFVILEKCKHSSDPDKLCVFAKTKLDKSAQKFLKEALIAARKEGKISDMLGSDGGDIADKLKTLAKGGEVKKYKKGGSVKKKNKMITTRGFGASRKT